MIKVLISDGAGSIALDQPGKARIIIRGLEELGIELAVASNGTRSQVERNFRDAGFTPPRVVVTRFDIGVSKPSPDFVTEIAIKTGVELNEIAFLGDDDQTDSLCAINAKVLPLLALYSTAERPRQYGLGIESPDYLIRYLRLYGLQAAPYFGWMYSGSCTDTGTNIEVKALLGQHSWAPEIRNLLKDQKDDELGPRHIHLSVVLFHYLITRIYLSGIARDMDYICVYPGHGQNTYNALLSGYLPEIRKVFRTRMRSGYADALLLRHTTAPESHSMGSRRNIYDQFRTIHVNPKYRERLNGKHVVVIDDFTTKGYSLETARRMLLNAGAGKVTCIAIGKWTAVHAVSSISAPWDSFTNCSLQPKDVRVTDQPGQFYPQADAHFQQNVWNYLRTS